MREKGRHFFLSLSFSVSFRVFALSVVGLWDSWQVQFFLESFNPIKITRISGRMGSLSSLSLRIERAPPLSNPLHTIYLVPMYCI